MPNYPGFNGKKLVNVHQHLRKKLLEKVPYPFDYPGVRKYTVCVADFNLSRYATPLADFGQVLLTFPRGWTTTLLIIQ